MTGNEQTTVGHTKADSTDTYIGRGPGGRHMLSDSVIPGDRGWLGNPFTAEKHGRDEAVEKFGREFYDKLERDDRFRKAVDNLAGDTLGCWCQREADDAPRCHGEVIADYLNNPERGESA